MFDYLYGKVAATEAGSIVVDIAGVGFRVQVPLPFSQKVRAGETLKIFVTLSLRNEEARLFGFASAEDRRLFEKLQTVNGVGPATALNILSSASAASLYQAILQEDLSQFRKIKGVGPKTAQRIVLELKGKVSPGDLHAGVAAKPGNIQADAVAALISLGYPQETALDSVSKAWKQSDNPTLDVLIKEALKHM
jgi:Holliday junction DNA helicase RuvA